jgi:hypothetical protein
MLLYVLFEAIWSNELKLVNIRRLVLLMFILWILYFHLAWIPILSMLTSTAAAKQIVPALKLQVDQF